MSNKIRVVEVTTSYGTNWYIEHNYKDEWVRGGRTFVDEESAMRSFKYHTEGEKVKVLAEGETVNDE